LIHFDSGIEIAKTFRSRHFDLFRYKIKIAKIKPVRYPARYPRGRMRASHSWFPHLPGTGNQNFEMVIFVMTFYWHDCFAVLLFFASSTWNLCAAPTDSVL
jgi:hypothetical protein